MSRYFDMGGQPVDVATWLRGFEDHDSRRVANDERDGITVSTVLLGLDHNWGDGPPLIFETMIFGGDHDQYQERYSTREQAEEGHRVACELAFGKDAA